MSSSPRCRAHRKRWPKAMASTAAAHTTDHTPTRIPQGARNNHTAEQWRVAVGGKAKVIVTQRRPAGPEYMVLELYGAMWPVLLEAGRTPSAGARARKGDAMPPCTRYAIDGQVPKSLHALILPSWEEPEGPHGGCEVVGGSVNVGC